MGKKILYCGGYQLPDKNGAAQRVVGIAKGLRALGNEVIFLNSCKHCNLTDVEEKSYFGFKCFEYRREPNWDYLLSAKTTLAMIKRIQPDAVIAYNYPAVALSRVRKYCKKRGIKCYADVTDWYDMSEKKPTDAMIKGFDTFYRMHVVHKKLDGVIAISRYLFDYYSDTVKTVLIPPTIDLEDEKWYGATQEKEQVTTFVYAGLPGVSKERLDKIVRAVGVVEREKQVRLNVVGITKEQFEKMYDWSEDIPNSVSFWGRVDHRKALQFVKQADWSIILRENNRVVKAGFPTKLVESISCGTPVVANCFSNIYDYLTEDNSICVEDMDDIAKYMMRAGKKKCAVDRHIFDYHNYLVELEKLMLRDTK